jgi:hypothetical protein
LKLTWAGLAWAAAAGQLSIQDLPWLQFTSASVVRTYNTKNITNMADIWLDGDMEAEEQLLGK